MGAPVTATATTATSTTTAARVLTRLLVLAVLAATCTVLGPAAEAGAQERQRATRVLAVRYAAAEKGTPYRWGAEGPRAFDCSGYTQWVFDRLGKDLPRTSDAQYEFAKPIRKRQLRRGDLVFFRKRGDVYHVGIFAGRRRIWHAPSTGGRVRLERIWGTRWKAGRVLGRG